VLPFWYSPNLAGTYLYIAMALVFLAEASAVRLGWQELAVMLGVGLHVLAARDGSLDRHALHRGLDRRPTLPWRLRSSRKRGGHTTVRRTQN
jgi:hypothetical protein